MELVNQLRIGVGIDTGRYGHRATFLRPDRRTAAEPLDFGESPEGYEQLAHVLKLLQSRHADCQVHVHIDAAGQYAENLQQFLRGLQPAVSVSVGEPKRNKDYHAAISPKRKTDATESYAMARFAVAESPVATSGLSGELLAVREITSRLQVKVRDATRAANRLHNLLARVFPELANLAPQLTASWVLTLLAKYPTPQKIARAHVATIKRIPYAPEKKINAIHQAAGKSIGCLQGAAAESLARLAVEEVQDVAQQRKKLEKLLENAYDALPASGHLQLTTISGIGLATAAVLTSKIVSIDRFSDAEKLVGYFGVFPRQHASGVDKNGKPNPSKTHRMSQQGNDLARSYLYSAAKTAIRCNPAVRALYKRLRARGTRGDVAMGHCMRKLLHLVFAVWKTNKPFDPNHHRWEDPAPTAIDQATPTREDEEAALEADGHQQEAAKEKAVGHNRDISSDRSVVTTASDIVDLSEASVKQADAVSHHHSVDYQFVRSQITLERMLEHLGLLNTLRPAGAEMRGPCPLHARADKRRRDFSVNLKKNVFCCFHPSCEARGNQLDLWAKLHDQTIFQAAQDLIETFSLSATRTEKRSP